MIKKQIILKLYNTETREKETIVPLNGHTILLYTCGPTVYDYAHIGNFRAYVFEDLLRRTLKFFGMRVNQAMNITDVEDKIIAKVREKKSSLKDFTEVYINAFFEDLETLGIEKAEHYPKATDHIADMIEIITGLLKKGAAYQGNEGNIFFSISHFPSYGRLSHFTLSELKPGASKRVSTDEYEKENVADFILWKSYDPKRDAGVFWESRFGKGRPGWHIECSAMAMKILGETIDIHVGGIDNMFPHHENEIAQSEAFTGKRFVIHWLHCKHLLVDQKKMSKSLQNFYTLRDLLAKGYSGREVRLMLLHTHYRSELNFTFQEMDAIVSSLQRLKDFIHRIRAITDRKENSQLPSILDTYFERFSEALADDLNISAALATLFDFTREINTLCDLKQLGKKDVEKVLNILREMDQVLGIIPLEAEEVHIPHELKVALDARDRARSEKNWLEADRQREFIFSQGYLIEDTEQGSRLKKIEIKK
ncbi:MAG: cysteine--tRNA ligase [Chlamydiae bacterium]|nr:cysteine--tRNA ligase [Chlamydiota bacterium]